MKLEIRKHLSWRNVILLFLSVWVLKTFFPLNTFVLVFPGILVVCFINFLDKKIRGSKNDNRD